jgi:hypothetical protein
LLTALTRKAAPQLQPHQPLKYLYLPTTYTFLNESASLLEDTMKQIRIWLFLLVCTAAALACDAPRKDTDSTAGDQINCGEELSCLQEYSTDCTPSVAVKTSKDELADMIITIQTRVAITGEEDGVCVVDIQTVSVELEYTQGRMHQMQESGYTADEIETQRQEILAGIQANVFSGICNLEPPELQTSLEHWETYPIEDTYLEDKECTER